MFSESNHRNISFITWKFTISPTLSYFFNSCCTDLPHYQTLMSKGRHYNQPSLSELSLPLSQMTCLKRLEMELPDQFHQYVKITPNDEKDESEHQLQPLTFTDHMNKIFHLAMHARNVALVESHNIQITPKDIKTSQKGQWVNDQIMDFYFSIIVDRSTSRNLPKVYAFSTFFYNKLLKTGHTAVRRWTKTLTCSAMICSWFPLISTCTGL